MKKIFRIAQHIVFAIFFITNIASAKIFDVKTFVLSNGMKVAMIEDNKAPVIKHMVWYPCGASDEETGKGGSAHLLEHLMFRGTAMFSGKRFEELMEQHGVNSSAFTGQDYTSYHQFADISKLEMLMLMEADRMQNLYISGDDFNKEKDIVYQERVQRIETSPIAMFMEKVRYKLWGNYPYARPVTGTVDEIRSLKKQDVVNYYRKFYDPKNAILVLAGNIDENTAKTLAEKYYGKLDSRNDAKTPKMYDFQNTGRQDFIVKEPKIKAGKLIFSYAVPSYNINPKEALTLEILSEYLNAPKTSPIYKELVENKKIVASISVSNGFSARGYDSFYIMAHVNKGIDVMSAKQQLHDALKRAIEEFNEKDLDIAKKHILADLIYISDNPNNAAYILGEMLAGGMSAEDISSYDEQISNVTLEQVNIAGHKLLNDYAAVFGVLIPEDESKNNN